MNIRIDELKSHRHLLIKEVSEHRENRMGKQRGRGKNQRNFDYIIWI